MSTTATYTSLQTDSLLSVTLDFSVLKENFTVMNEFIKQFGQFQKRILLYLHLYRVHIGLEIAKIPGLELVLIQTFHLEPTANSHLDAIISQRYILNQGQPKPIVT